MECSLDIMFFQNFLGKFNIGGRCRSESSLAVDEDIVEVVKVDEDGAGVVVSTYEVAELLVNELTELVVGEVES